MNDIVGEDNWCFAANSFLEDLVNGDDRRNEEPLMSFVLGNDGPNSPNSHPVKANQEVMDNFEHMATSLQTDPSYTTQPTGNSVDSSKKRPREPENAISPEQINSFHQSCNKTGEMYGDAKKAKSTGEILLVPDSNVNCHHNLNSKCIDQGTYLEINRPPVSYDSLHFPPNSQTPPVHPLGEHVNLQGHKTSSAGGNESGYKEEIHRYQPVVNPCFTISDSPISTYSDEDLSSVYTPNSNQSIQENQASFTCQNPSQITNSGNCSILASNLEKKQNNPMIRNPFRFGNNEPLLNKSHSRSNTSSLATSGSTFQAFCKVVNPRKEYDKNQKKLLAPRRSEQRIQGGKVIMQISTKIPLAEHAPVEVFVRREPSAAQKQYDEHPDQFTMDMTRIPDLLTMNNEETHDSNYHFTYKCQLDLDSVYLTAEGKEVYKLVKTKGATNNRFQLCVYLRYSNEVEESVIPYEFVLKSGRTPTQQDHHRDRHDAGMGEASDGPRAHLVSCQYLDAETARIRNIRCENIETKNHDIAYFMRVKSNEDDVPSDMEKGDVVAFLEDEEGDTYIAFLTSENARKARLAGVISRTAFFRGRTAICDPDHIDCDLVCIIGEVEVKVVGKVQAGDLIYTSNCEQYRGSAVAKNPLETGIQDSLSENGDPTPKLLGMAMESNSELDIKLVRCLVSIVLGISDLHQRRTLQELRNCHDKIVKIQRYLKGIWKKSLVLLLFFLVTGITCYLFLAPNSPYLIMKCEKGCKKNKGSCQDIKFEYFPDIAQESDEIVGIRFMWLPLKRKLELSFNKYPNQTGYRYYLNKNRCVTGGIRAISSWLDPSPRIPRVNVLAVSHNCSQVFYYSAAKRHWEEYDETKIRVVKCDR